MRQNTYVAVTAIKPKGLNLEKYRENIMKEMEIEVRTTKQMFQRTVKTWKKKAAFKTKIATSSKGELRGATYTESEIYSYINFGTRVRWALMSKDFKAKTKPRILDSYPGQGRAILVGKKAFMKHGLKPRPGIKERRYDLVITRIRKPLFQKAINAAIRKAAR